jgi:hypothetical protein
VATSNSGRFYWLLQAGGLRVAYVSAAAHGDASIKANTLGGARRSDARKLAGQIAPEQGRIPNKRGSCRHLLLRNGNARRRCTFLHTDCLISRHSCAWIPAGLGSIFYA